MQGAPCLSFLCLSLSTYMSLQAEGHLEKSFETFVLRRLHVDVSQVCLVSPVLTDNDRQQEITFSPSYYIIILASTTTPSYI